VSGGLAAVTGATGFLGQHIVRALADDGWRVRILSRREPISSFWTGITPQVVIGDLEDEQALTRLCQGADLVIHAAGLVAGDTTDLQRVNVESVGRLAAAAKAGHVIHVSSLAAREPQLSPYAASKRAGEDLARALLGDRVTIVRPPAIYGPGDRATLDIFQVAAHGLILPALGSESKVALVHVHDAARQIVSLGRSRPPGNFALSDAQPQGYGWREIMLAAAQAFGRRPPVVRIPATGLYVAAAVDMVVNSWRRRRAMLTFGKVKELTHPDWGIRADERAPNAPAPEFDLKAGFAHTIAWYRAQGWLRA